jgi:hypothetical protein
MELSCSPVDSSSGRLPHQAPRSTVRPRWCQRRPFSRFLKMAEAKAPSGTLPLGNSLPWRCPARAGDILSMYTATLIAGSVIPPPGFYWRPTGRDAPGYPGFNQVERPPTRRHFTWAHCPSAPVLPGKVQQRSHHCGTVTGWGVSPSFEYVIFVEEIGPATTGGLRAHVSRRFVLGRRGIQMTQTNIHAPGGEIWEPDFFC